MEQETNETNESNSNSNSNSYINNNNNNNNNNDNDNDNSNKNSKKNDILATFSAVCLMPQDSGIRMRTRVLSLLFLHLHLTDEYYDDTTMTTTTTTTTNNTTTMILLIRRKELEKETSLELVWFELTLVHLRRRYR
uniref:Uncharacterized protein n=1 Tax=Vespula pensylvanica TaxID=30213 RepID=A0A834KD85_VESPE|nr:hypothetical protein H0235_015119 [Vespula pensylvanica]